MARRFFMGRILTAVVGRSSLVVGLPLFDVTRRNLRCSVVCQKPTTNGQRPTTSQAFTCYVPPLTAKRLGRIMTRSAIRTRRVRIFAL